jgi:hypothetical protein
MDKYNRMLEEVRDLVVQGESLEDIRDAATEYADSWVPVYNSDIIKEWTEMDSEFNDIGATEYGATGGILQLMTVDLFYCYSHYYELAINEVEEEEKEKEESEEE